MNTVSESFGEPGRKGFDIPRIGDNDANYLISNKKIGEILKI